MTAADDSDTSARRLTADERRALLEIRHTLASTSDPRAFLRELVAAMARVLHVKCSVAGRRGTRWVVAAESAPAPPLALAGAAGAAALDAAIASARGVETWRTRDGAWTLVRLADSSTIPVVLVLQEDWLASTAALRDVARSLAAATEQTVTERTAVLALRLAQALTGAAGMGAVADVVLHHVVQAVPSGVACLAVANADDELTIVATHGYPRALVEDLRIASGSGVVGSVHASKAPVVVDDVRAMPGLDRHRSRYRTRSFMAVPVLAGSDCLGVLSLTDRPGAGPYSRDDLAAAATMLAPAALALGRERSWQEAQAYAQAAVMDPVSGLFNRRYFQTRLDEELQRAIRQFTSVGLLMIDLDGFKSINDRFGHIAGDVVIRDISEILRRSVRIFDVCTRFGGEEFAVMMPGGTAESAGAIAERIRQRVEAYRRTEADVATLRVTASIGVAVSPPGTTARELIERADRALYDAKHAGRNRVSTSTPAGA